MSTSSVFKAAAAAILLATAGLAQEAASVPPAPAPPEPALQAASPAAAPSEAALQAESTERPNPHAMLPALTGGPLGSPTALRGNPVPGTSTSIPTMNPARVAPLPAREGKPVERENTGIDGQCDPVVSFGECPNLPAAAAAQAATTGAAPAPASAATGAANAETSVQPGTGQIGNGQTDSSGN